MGLGDDKLAAATYLPDDTLCHESVSNAYQTIVYSFRDSYETGSLSLRCAGDISWCLTMV